MLQICITHTIGKDHLGWSLKIYQDYTSERNISKQYFIIQQSGFATCVASETDKWGHDGQNQIKKNKDYQQTHYKMTVF